MADIFAFLLIFSLAKQACLSKVSLLKQDKLVRHIFIGPLFGPLNLNKIEMVPFG
jgi:hypothetical protein